MFFRPCATSVRRSNRRPFSGTADLTNACFFRLSIQELAKLGALRDMRASVKAAYATTVSALVAALVTLTYSRPVDKHAAAATAAAAAAAAGGGAAARATAPVTHHGRIAALLTQRQDVAVFQAAADGGGELGGEQVCAWCSLPAFCSQSAFCRVSLKHCQKAVVLKLSGPQPAAAALATHLGCVATETRHPGCVTTETRHPGCVVSTRGMRERC